MRVTCVLTVVSPMISSAAISRVCVAGREQPEHLEFAWGELIEFARRGFGGPGGGEFLDQAARDAGREQCVAVPDGADGGDELARGDVLEEEPARSGA